MPPLTTLADAPIKVALPPRVAPNIMAINTGSVTAGQSINPDAERGLGHHFRRYQVTFGHYQSRGDHRYVGQQTREKPDPRQQHQRCAMKLSAEPSLELKRQPLQQTGLGESLHQTKNGAEKYQRLPVDITNDVVHRLHLRLVNHKQGEGRRDDRHRRRQDFGRQLFAE